MMPSLHRIAQALGGDVRGGQVIAPAPGHSPADRGMSIKLSDDAPDGFVVKLFNEGDPIAAKDYIRNKLGMPPWQPNGKGGKGYISPGKEMARAAVELRNGKPAVSASPVRAPHLRPKPRRVSLRHIPTLAPTASYSTKCCGWSRKASASVGPSRAAAMRGTSATCGQSSIACPSCSSFRTRQFFSARAKRTPTVSPRSI